MSKRTTAKTVSPKDNGTVEATAAAPGATATTSRPATEEVASSPSSTSALLSAARRVRDYKREGRGLSRQLDIAAPRTTPQTGVIFRAWPDPGADYPVCVLRVKTDDDRKEDYILAPDIADLSYVAPRVRNADLVACVTTTGKVFVWAVIDPDPGNRLAYRTYAALARVCEEARKGWVSITWEPALTIHLPRTPIEEEARWPDGQTLEEMLEISMRASYIDSKDHPVIRALDTIGREV
jgi:hypothetical protein